MIKTILKLYLLLMIACPVLASQEGTLPFSSFKLESFEVENFGKVTIAGTQNEKGINKLTISAFGKEIKLQNEQINQLKSVVFNGIRITFEHGYEILGGRTFYIMFSQGFMSGNIKEKILSINERGDISIDTKSKNKN